MPSNKQNNPRSVAETVSLVAWHTGFEGETAEAKLCVDLNFRIGKIGADENSPVRFRVRLKRAEVYILNDPEGILKPLNSTLARSPLPTERHRGMQRKTSGGAIGGSVSAGPDAAKAEAHAGGKISREREETIQFDRERPLMEVLPKHRSDALGFEVKPISGQYLEGSPWHATEPRLHVRDTNPNRERGLPPSPAVRIECLREDLDIYDVQFKKDKWRFFDLSREKQAATLQALKAEIMESGFQCGDLNEPFTRLVLADAIAHEE